MYIYFLNKQNLDLSVAEVLALAKTKVYTLVGNCLLLAELVDYKRLAYTKRVYELLFETAEEHLIEAVHTYDFNRVFKESFRLRLVNGKDFDVEALANIIWQNLKIPVTNMRDAKTKIDIIFCEKVFCCLLVGEQDDRFEDRKAHLRPYNHPTSLHPRLARCLVNLVHSEEILDPFCGSGGLLIEAGLIGLKTFGYDIDDIMLKRAEANLKFFEVKNFKVEKHDALRIEKKFEAIVTDLPYGKNSKVDDLQKTFSEFLKNSFNFTEKMVVVFPDFVDAKKLIKTVNWKIKNTFSYYIHKTLTKEIFVLGKHV
ncbi:MAG: methyltransferase domain-containing protein [archaeon]